MCIRSKCKSAVPPVAMTLLLLLAPGCSTRILKVHRAGDPELGSYRWHTIREKNAKPKEYLDARFRDDRGTVPVPELPEVHLERRGREVTAASASPGEPILTFYLMADVQLRDERARFWSFKGSKLGDKLLHTFEHSEEQMLFDHDVYTTMIRSLNRLYRHRLSSAVAAGSPPDLSAVPLFAVHAGDALEAGTVLELEEYLAMSEHLEVPLLQAIGNHDVNIFGNFMTETVYLGNPVQGHRVINGTDQFALAHRSSFPDADSPEGRQLSDHYDGRLPVELHMFGEFDHPPTETFLFEHGGRGIDDGHGLTWKTRIDEDVAACYGEGNWTAGEPFYLGYYSVRLNRPRVEERQGRTGARWSLRWDGEPSGITLVVLNTYDNQKGKIFRWHRGRISSCQRQWLEGQISMAETRGDHVLLFGHHALKSFESKEQGRSLARLFAENASVIAYLAGHTHAHDVVHHPAQDGGFGFWEIIAGSLVAWPQESAVVTLRESGGGLAIDLQPICLPVPPARDQPCDLRTAESLSPLEGAACAHDGARRDNVSRKKARLRAGGNCSNRPTVDEEDRLVRLIVP